MRLVMAVLLAACVPAFAAETPFAAAQPLASGGLQPRAVAVADLDRDGDTDLVFALQSPPQVAVRLRLPGGGYGAPVLVADPGIGQSPPQRLRLPDLDDDGDADIVFLKQDGSLCHARNDGSGGFAAAACTAFATRAEFADLNRDGMLDLVAATASGVAWSVGARDGSFASPVSITFQRGASGVAVADFDRDGRPDVARADEGINAGLTAHLNPGTSGNWSTVQLFDTAVSALAAIDIDADGDMDLAAGRCSTTGHVILRRNDGAANFDSVTGIGVDAPSPGQTPCPRALVAVDLDRDGRTDLVEADSHGRVLYFRNTVDGFTLERMAASVAVSAGSAFHDAAVADLDLDGDPDIIAAHGNEDVVALSENRSLHRALRGGATQSGGVTMAGAETLLSGDVDRDGLPDVVTASRTDGVVRLLRRTPAGFAPAVTLDTGATSARGGAIADVNRDGKPDLVFGNLSGGDVQMKFGFGDGTFDATLDTASGFLDIGDIAAADFDRDGDVDLAVTDPAIGAVRWLRNSGGGSFTVQPGASSLTGVRTLGVADIDRDGWPDLLATSDTANSVHWLRNELRVAGLPNFTAVLISDAPEIAGPRDATAADADRDGLPDVFVNSAGSRLSWLRQTAPGTFGPSQSLTSVISGTGSVFATDIDGDARTDLAYTLGGVLTVLSDPVFDEGNGGYLVSSSQPRLALALDDLDANGMTDVFEVNSGGGLSARLTAVSNARLAGDLTTMAFAPRQVDLHLASLTLQHDGRDTDDALGPRRIAFAFRRNGGTGALLSGAEFSQLFSQVRLFGDDGDDTYEPGVDPLLADAAAADFNNGALSFALPASAQSPLAFGATRTFHFVAQVSPGAQSVTRILHISPSAIGSEAVNAVFETRVDLSNDTFGTTLDLDVIFRSRFQ